MERQEQTNIFEPSSQKFQIYSSSKLESISSLELFPSSLKIQYLNRQINWLDILAIKPYKQEKILIQVELLLFVKQKKWLKGVTRCEEGIVFYVMPEHLEKLLLKVRRLITQSTIDEPKFLVFHNPISGANSEEKLIRGLEFLKNTHFKYKVVTTKYKGHCTEYLKQHKPTRNQYWGVAIFSGDGLMHEFVNARLDIPVIHVPAGSGNAFAKNQAVHSNENCSIQENLFIGMKGKVIKISAMELQLEKIPQKIYSVLGIQWALLADIDMQSEFLRCFGGFRFQLMAVWRYIFLRTYRGKISVSQTDSDLPDINEPITSPSFQTYESNIFCFMLMVIPYIAQKYHVTPHLQMDSEVLDIQVITEQTGRFQFLKYLLNFEGGNQFNEDKTPKYNFNHHLVKSFRLEPLGERLGILGIDGEQFEAQKIQGRRIPQVLSIFSLV